MAHTMSDEELKELYSFALDLGRRAGKILRDGVDMRCGDSAGRTEIQQEQKVNSVDIVTQTDLDVEAFIHKEITKKYPTHDFIGEETYSSGSSKEYLIKSGPTWCVDPLDGTVNYTHLFNMYCVSIAFILNSQPIVGVIYQPMLDVTYSALSGHGSFQDDSHAWKKRRALPLINNPKVPFGELAPKGCIFSCEWGKDRRDVEGGNMLNKVNSFVNMATEIGGRGGKGGMVHGVRSLGSAALDLAYVASGAFDIWWEGGCWEWDVAAGICILKEAGGLITTAKPPPNPMTDPIEEVRLGSRFYLAIRPAGDSEKETGRQAQERVVRETWKRVYNLDYTRPGA